MIKDTGHPRHDCNNNTARKKQSHKDSQDTKAVTGQNKNAMLRRITYKSAREVVRWQHSQEQTVMAEQPGQDKKDMGGQP
jgi:hypothetical protein